MMGKSSMAMFCWTSNGETEQSEPINSFLYMEQHKTNKYYSINSFRYITYIKDAYLKTYNKKIKYINIYLLC